MSAAETSSQSGIDLTPQYLLLGTLLVIAGFALFIANLLILPHPSTPSYAPWIYGAPLGGLVVAVGAWFLVKWQRVSRIPA
jgi:hypothetical protein